MLTDAHCHPYDLEKHFPAAEDQRHKLGVICAASASSMEEFNYCVRLFPPILPCFAVHPQMPLTVKNRFKDSLAALENLAEKGWLAAVGETGFDLYNTAFRETESIQDSLFAAHLETALRCDLPLVLHVRRAMHKIFNFSDKLKKCRAVIFHSWPGTAGEGESLLKRGINAFFSFGTGIMLNHREAIRCCTVFPADRLLAETDAPYQPLRGNEFSTYDDLNRILETAAALRGESKTNLETIIENNFRRAFDI